MPKGSTYRFDSRATDYSTCFLVDGDKVAYLADAVFPPVGTIVETGDNDWAVVRAVRLALSDPKSLAMVYVQCERVDPKTAMGLMEAPQ